MTLGFAVEVCVKNVAESGSIRCIAAVFINNIISRCRSITAVLVCSVPVISVVMIILECSIIC